MKKLAIKYNPYQIITEFIVDGMQPKADSNLHVGSSRLQEWAEQLPYWLMYEYNDREWDVQFTGTEGDYIDLQTGFDISQSGISAQFSINRMPDVDEAEEMIDQIFTDVQNGPIEELKIETIRETFEKVKNQEFEISVVATMSSGKSTLINALLGHELMPSANEATTATIVRIIDDDNTKVFKAKAYNTEGKLVKTIDDVTLKDMQEMNKDENIPFVDIIGPIPFVSASGMKLVLIDTPGPNNARNKQHEELTYRMIADSDKSMVLFVMNAQQIGINDEKLFLDYVCNTMKKGGKQSKDRFLFVVNKINCFDPQPKHDGPGCIRRTLNGVKKDLEDRGIRNPNIFPIAALPALQLREEDRFGSALSSYQLFSNAFDEMHFDQYNDFSHIPVSLQKKLDNKKNDASIEEMLEIHTGIISLEEAINLYVKKYARTTKVMDLALAFNNRVEELSTENNLLELLHEDQAAKVEIEKQISQIRKNIESARNAQTFSNKVDKLDLVSNVQLAVKELFKGLRAEISTMKANREIKVEFSNAQQQCIEIEKKTQSIITQLKVELDKIIFDSYKSTIDGLIAEYKQYLEELNMVESVDKLKLNPLKLVGSQFDPINIRILMTAHSEEKTEIIHKTETYKLNSGDNTLGNAITGGLKYAKYGLIAGTAVPVVGTLIGGLIGAAVGGLIGAVDGDTRKSETKTRAIELPQKVRYVNMQNVVNEFSQSILDEFAKTEKMVLNHVNKETSELKSFISRHLSEIDKVLDSKLGSLAEYETDIREKDTDIAKRQYQLRWLKDIESRVNSIVYY